MRKEKKREDLPLLRLNPLSISMTGDPPRRGENQ